MKLDEVTRESLALHWAYQKMGFRSEDIFMELALVYDASRVLLHEKTKDGDLGAHVVLKAQGLEYTGGIGAIGRSGEDFEKTWLEAIDWLKTAPEKELLEVWAQSKVRTMIPSVVWAMQQKGFRFKPFLS